MTGVEPPKTGGSGPGMSGARARLLAGLRAAHVALRRAEGLAGFDAGVRAGCAAFLGVATLDLGLRLIGWLLALREPLVPWTHAVAVAAFSIPLGALLGWLRGRARMPTLAAAAERLDRAAETKGRIAAALDLSRGPAGAFEAAAIEDGLAVIDAAARVPPAGPARRKPGRGEAFALALGAAALAVSAFVPRRIPASGEEPAPRPDGPAALAEAPAVPPAGPPRREDRTPRETAPPAAAPQDHRPEAQPPATAKGSSPEASGDRQKSAGRPGPGKDVEAQRSRQASAAQGEPTEGTSPPPLPGDRPPKTALPKKAADATKLVRPPRQKEDKTGATAGQAGAGGGAMSPVKSAWTQRDRSADDPLPENPAEEDIEDEPEEEEARGGTQPTLKDRKGATSRDLSISGPGDPDNGRGGPSPQKKARGVASLVLGVPVPDFVRGLLNPGTTKVTHERVEPVPSDAAPRPPVAAAARTRPEPAVGPAEIPPSLREALKRFFIAVHAPDPKTP